jgi:hypothetical protein
LNGHRAQAEICESSFVRTTGKNCPALEGKFERASLLEKPTLEATTVEREATA